MFCDRHGKVNLFPFLILCEQAILNRRDSVDFCAATSFIINKNPVSLFIMWEFSCSHCMADESTVAFSKKGMSGQFELISQDAGLDKWTWSGRWPWDYWWVSLVLMFLRDSWLPAMLTALWLHMSGIPTITLLLSHKRQRLWFRSTEAAKIPMSDLEARCSTWLNQNLSSTCV